MRSKIDSTFNSNKRTSSLQRGLKSEQGEKTHVLKLEPKQVTKKDETHKKSTQEGKQALVLELRKKVASKLKVLPSPVPIPPVIWSIWLVAHVQSHWRTMGVLEKDKHSRGFATLDKLCLLNHQEIKSKVVRASKSKGAAWIRHEVDILTHIDRILTEEER